MSFLASLPRNIFKFTYTAEGLPTYKFVYDGVLATETRANIIFERFEQITLIEKLVKVVSDTLDLADVLKEFRIPVYDTVSIVERLTYVYREIKDILTFLDIPSLKVMMYSELVSVQEYMKAMGLEGVSPEKLSEYLSELPTIIEEELPRILSELRYVKEGDMVMAKDFNEILGFTRNTVKVILALVKILLDNNVDIPEEVMELITEVVGVLL